MKIASTLAALALAGLATTACAATSVNTTADKGHAAKGGDSGSTAKLGQPITIKGNDNGEQAQVTATHASTTNATDGFSSPSKGDAFYAVQFKIANTGTKAYDDAPSNGAVVVDSKGQQYESTIVDKVAAGALLPAQVKITPKGSALGYVVFEIPTKAKITQVQFSMDSGFGDTAQWNIK